jgi:DnaK suppressor protein
VNVRVGSFVVDFLWPSQRLVVELDGYRAHGSRSAFEADRARDAELVALGFSVIRITWRQLEDPRLVAATVRRLRRAHARGMLGDHYDHFVDPERARERLAEERAQIERELEGIGRQEPGEEPEDEGDQADDLDQAGKDEAIREQLQRTLEAIQKAEERLDDGSYGKSVISGEPIPDERLEALPWADRLVEEEPGGRG